MKIVRIIYKALLKFPVTNRFAQNWYKKLGIQVSDNVHISNHIQVVGAYNNIIMHKNSEINDECFLLAKDRIEIGENSTLGYKVTILTSANPNGPYNLLSKIYPAMRSPVIIGDNVWVGANATILPGVKIGNFSVIAAGSVVIKDVPDGVMVAGNPATIKKRLLNL